MKKVTAFPSVADRARIVFRRDPVEHFKIVTWATAFETVPVISAQPTNGDHMNCTRFVRMIMGVADHPGTGRMKGWSN